MLSPAAERDQWGPRFDSPPSTSAPASQAHTTGRKRKANFSNDETETLVWNVVRHFGALYDSESFRAHPVRRKQLWAQIQSRVNFLGYTERSVDDLKHKWRDLRLDVKKKMTAKKPLPLHRLGAPHKPRLTPLEKMVASTFLQPTHDSEPEIALDPEIFFPGVSKQSFLPRQPGVSHPSIYIDTNGQSSSLPDMEDSAGPHMGVDSPDTSVVCDYSTGEGQSSSAESGPELRTPDLSAASPPVRNESLVSYASEEEERGSHEAESRPGLEASLSAEGDRKVSSHQAMLLRRCGSQESVASVAEEALGCKDPPADWGHEGPSNFATQGQGLNSSQLEDKEAANQRAELDSLPRTLMGPRWEKREDDPPSRSPLHFGAFTGESLPPPTSPPVEPVPVSQPLPQGMGFPPLRDGHRDTWRTNVHRLMDMEDQWDQLYHQELAMWQEERAQQREERARDRELQFRLLAVLTDIRDELRHFRQERAANQQEKAAGRQKQESQTVTQAATPKLATSSPKSEGGSSEISPKTRCLQFPLKTEGLPSGPTSGRARRGEGATVTQNPHGVSRRGRGRPRGSVSKHRKSLMSHS